jgi:hypothetical protein
MAERNAFDARSSASSSTPATVSQRFPLGAIKGATPPTLAEVGTNLGEEAHG